MVKIENDDEATARIEAALYSAGRPLSIEDLIKASGTESRTKTLNLLNLIMKKAKLAFKAIEVVTLPDDSYVFQLKPEYSSTIRRYASKPIFSKQLVETRGSGVYLHLKELRQLDYIENQNVGRLKIYSTTTKFQKYFGIQGDADSLKQKLFKRVRKSPHIAISSSPQTVASQA